MPGRPSSGAQERSPGRGLPPAPAEHLQSPAALFSSSTEPSVSPGKRGSNTNGHLTATGTGQYVIHGAYDNSRDAEAAAGFAEMQMAEEKEAREDARRRSITASSLFSGNFGSQRQAQPQPQSDDLSSDSDYAGAGGFFSGGYEGNMHYRDASSPGQSAAAAANQMQNPENVLNISRPSSGSANRNLAQSSVYDFSIPDQEAVHPFPSFDLGARGDTGGIRAVSRSLREN
jgi:hypothetical protein